MQGRSCGCWLKRVSNLESSIRTQCMIQNALWLGMEGVELDDALKFAGEQGWVENAPEDTTKLTDAGYAAGMTA
jgi:hypothetical protein